MQAKVTQTPTVRRGPLAILLALSAVACGGSPADVGLDSAAIVDGAPDVDHDGVVGIIRLGTGTCSAAVLTPDVVLTARHCVTELVALPASQCEDTVSGDGAFVPGVTLGESWTEQLSVFAGDVKESWSPRYDVVEALVPPDAPKGALWCGQDIALLRLAEPMPSAVLVTPRLDLPPLVAETFTAVGYGYTAAARSESYGVRRAHQGRIEWVGASHADSYAWTLDGEWESADAYVCNGDSGGPALDIEGRVIGVASRTGATYCSGPGIYQGVAAYAAWLREQVGEQAARLGIAPPAWVTPPAVHGASFGEACAARDGCAAGLACLPVGDTFRCTTTSCDDCPSGWICGEILDAVGCVPDPSPPAQENDPPPPDSPAAAEADASRSAGCAMVPGGRCPAGGSHRGTAAALLAIGLATATARRRR